jgi:hypothetical protein
MTYADDTLLPARTKTALSDALQEFEGAARNLGLKINGEKTKYTNTTRNQTAIRQEYPTDGVLIPYLRKLQIPWSNSNREK